MVRNIAGVIAGVVVGSLVNLIFVALNLFVLFPSPPGLDPSDPAQLAEYVGGLPIGGFVMILLAHNAQAFVGGWLAARIGATAPVALAMVIGVLTALGGAYNLATMPGPAWMWIDVPLNLAAAYAAGAWVSSARR